MHKLPEAKIHFTLLFTLQLIHVSKGKIYDLVMNLTFYQYVADMSNTL